MNRWHFYQILVDLLTVSATASLLLWAFVFSKSEMLMHFDLKDFYGYFFLFIDFILLTEIGLIILSKGSRTLTKGKAFTLLGIAIYTASDLYYAYLTFFSEYDANTLIDAVYLLSKISFAVSAYFDAKSPSVMETAPTEDLPENLRKPRKIAFLPILVYLIFYLMGYFDIVTLIHATASCLLYWILTAAVRANMLDKLLLQTQKDMTMKLELLVSERTQDLNQANQYLEELSHRDVLTGLYNRRYLLQHLDDLFRQSDLEPFALLYIDTNRFKSINDSFGHETGDKVLQSIGQRFLTTCTPNCTAFRTGGDEFAVIIEHYSDLSDVRNIANKVLAIVQEPICVPPYTFTVTASIGIALYPDNTRDKDILMWYADMAMYEVKNSNLKNEYRFFDKAILQKINRKQEIELMLPNINYNEEFVLHYQPQFSAEGKRLIGMEALIRWMHPQKGLIPPNEFIPIAEETGVIFYIGKWVIEKAFTQIKKWNTAYGMHLKMGINISPIQLENPDFIDWLQTKMQTDGIDPDWVDLEITENIAMNSVVSTQELFGMLDKLGVNISIDDFGTGYSSMSYIRKFSIDCLKVAKELVDHIDSDENALLIVKSIIMMTKGMGIRTIAEGVEYESQFEILKGLGCDEIQGYLLGRPVPSIEFEKLYLMPTHPSGA